MEPDPSGILCHPISHPSRIKTVPPTHTSPRVLTCDLHDDLEGDSARHPRVFLHQHVVPVLPEGQVQCQLAGSVVPAVHRCGVVQWGSLGPHTQPERATLSPMAPQHLHQHSRCVAGHKYPVGERCQVLPLSTDQWGWGCKQEGWGTLSTPPWGASSLEDSFSLTCRGRSGCGGPCSAR